ncbi:MAG: hypothetical protein IT454_21450 [Planctomycetes bacterium]|nr:hypothetical protein [Planctomycetota bacterium]
MKLALRCLVSLSALALASCRSLTDLEGADRDVWMPGLEARWMWKGEREGWFLQGRARGGEGQFGESVPAGEVLEVGDATIQGPERLDVRVQMRNGELALGRRVAGGALEFAWFAGVEFVNVEIELEGPTQAAEELRSSRNALGGLWLSARINERWSVEFGHTRSAPLFGDPLFATSTDALLTLRLNEWSRCYVGWRSMQMYEYEDSEVDLEISGPAFGLGVEL